MPKSTRKPRTTMTMDELQSRLCRLFRLSEKRAIHAEEDGNDEIQLRHTNACAALAPQIRGAHEVSDQEQRIAKLEAQVVGRLRKVG